MSGGIHASPRALGNLKDAVERFSTQIRSLACESIDIAAGIERHVESLEEEARDNVLEALAALSGARGEDRAGAISDLEDARDRVRTVRRALNNAERAFSKLRRAAESAREVVDHGGNIAIAHLQLKISQLADYSAGNLDGAAASPAGFPSSPGGFAAEPERVSPHATSRQAPDLVELQKAILPVGWKWVALSEIDMTRVQGETLAISDETRQELTERFDRLRRDVLPLLDRNRSAAADRLREHDIRNGIHDASGGLGAFETFFSTSSPIHLQRAAGVAQYTIDDGRHRIEIARFLGWPAVPARTTDLSHGR